VKVREGVGVGILAGMLRMLSMGVKKKGFSVPRRGNPGFEDRTVDDDPGSGIPLF
jgi:hypothetical protein